MQVICGATDLATREALDAIAMGLVRGDITDGVVEVKQGHAEVL